MYPININLTGRSVAVVGGGRVALRKLKRLLAEGAMITVLAPHVLPEIEALSTAGDLVWHRGSHDEFAWAQGGFVLVFAATDSFAVNSEVCKIARSIGALANSATEPEACDFFVPASIMHGDMELTVSTNGGSPALARLLREDMENRYHEDFGAFLTYLKKLRHTLKDIMPDTKARQHLWRQLMNRQLFDLILNHRLEQAKDEIRREISSAGVKPPHSTSGNQGKI